MLKSISLVKKNTLLKMIANGEKYSFISKSLIIGEEKDRQTTKTSYVIYLHKMKNLCMQIGR